jgi:hypothetical protein
MIMSHTRNKTLHAEEKVTEGKFAAVVHGFLELLTVPTTSPPKGRRARTVTCQVSQSLKGAAVHILDLC